MAYEAIDFSKLIGNQIIVLMHYKDNFTRQPL